MIYTAQLLPRCVMHVEIHVDLHKGFVIIIVFPPQWATNHISKAEATYIVEKYRTAKPKELTKTISNSVT